MPAVGVYPVADALTAGDEISSTYEGRHLTLREDELKHPSHPADGFVNKGDPVIVCQAASEANFGAAIGVAFLDGLSAATLIPIDTEGIWVLEVLANDDNGGSAVVPGDRLYINTTTCIISKINNTATQLPFGYAMGRITATLSETIAVKVHWDPSLDTADQMFKTVTSGTYNYGKQWVGLLEAGQSTGVAGYFAAQIDGQQAGGIYGFGAWTEPQAGFIGSAHLLVAGDFGFYAHDNADPSLSWVVGLQYMSDWKIAPATMNVIRVNINQNRVANPMTAVWAFGNPQSCGYIAAVTQVDPPVGYVPWGTIVGVGTVYIRLYADTD